MVAAVVSYPPISPAAPAAPSCTTQDHEAMKAAPARWAALPFTGFQGLKLHTLELRQCPLCGSTLAREVRILSVEYLDQVQPAEARHAAGGAG